MGKEFLEKLIKDKMEQRDALKVQADKSEKIEEVRSLGERSEQIAKEIEEARAELAKIELAEKREAEKAKELEDGDQDLPKNTDMRSLDPMATFTQGGQPEQRDAGDDDVRGTQEYRSAFMNYIQTGRTTDVLKAAKRSADVGTSSDLGILLPTTIVQDIMKDVEKVYGQLYSRVKKTNIKGGVKVPIGDFSATFNRISEDGEVSDRQKAGKVSGYIEFSYNIGEIRLARTLLQSILSVESFEKEFAKVAVEAYVKAMDYEILHGDPEKNEMCGILTEAAKDNSRISGKHIIEVTEDDMADWAKWQEKVFAIIPLSMRGLKPEFVMTPNTYEANIKTLKDNNNRPVYTETFNPVDGAEISRFKGKDVVFVEEDMLKNFNDAADGEYFGMYWVPEKAYGINTNMEFMSVEYDDHDKNQKVTKALVINDGKVLNPNYLFLLRKKVVA